MSASILAFLVPSGWNAIWFWLLIGIGLVWLRRHLDLNRADEEPRLDPDARPPSPAPRVSLLVAAKDEEANIGRCLDSLLRQDYPELEIIAVDDRSSDRTGVILDAYAARHAKLLAVHVPALPAGWCGKNHAMHVGSTTAAGEFLCLTDADCVFEAPNLISAAVAYARLERVDMLSALPELETHGFWERVVQPPAGAIMLYWYAPRRVNDPGSSVAYANGAFVLIRRAAYEQVGGHSGLRSVIQEDMELARCVKNAGLRLRVVRSMGMYRVRMYSGFRQIWSGWSRIFHGCFGSWHRLIVSAVFLSVFSVFPAVSLLAAPWLGDSAAGFAAAAGFALVAQQSVLWRFYALCGQRAAWAVTYPLGAAICLGATLNAMRMRLRARVRWRGTTYVTASSGAGSAD